MLRLAVAVASVAALLALPASAAATHNDPFAGARDGLADLVPDEETVAGFAPPSRSRLTDLRD